MAGQMPLYWPLEKLPHHYWNSTEQLYQASKYRKGLMCLPKAGTRLSHLTLRSRIRAMSGPRGAKMTQKCAVKAGLIRADWENIKIQAMVWVLELKLFHHPKTFGAELTKTGDLPIVEVSRKDDFWGCKEVDEKLVGQNHLGRSLMQVRDKQDQVIKGKFTHPNGFLLPPT